jgi:hypothetical protein
MRRRNEYNLWVNALILHLKKRQEEVDRVRYEG